MVQGHAGRLCALLLKRSAAHTAFIYVGGIRLPGGGLDITYCGLS
jgi:hypothetical protein